MWRPIQFRAPRWYLKAIETPKYPSYEDVRESSYDRGIAANNLMLLFQQGVGEAEDLKEAAGIFKLADGAYPQSADMSRKRQGYAAYELGISDKDPTSGLIFEVEKDGRHIRATDASGSLVWRREPFVEGGLEPYREAWPRIAIMSFKPAGTKWADRTILHDELWVTYTSTQALSMDLMTGKVEFYGQD